MRRAPKRRSKPARTASRESRNSARGRDRARHVVDQQPGHTVIDHLRHRATPKCQYGGTARHRLDRNEPKGFGPVDGHEQGASFAHQVQLSLFIALA
jgi:hypothetical protein